MTEGFQGMAKRPQGMTEGSEGIAAWYEGGNWL